MPEGGLSAVTHLLSWERGNEYAYHHWWRNHRQRVDRHHLHHYMPVAPDDDGMAWPRPRSQPMQEERIPRNRVWLMKTFRLAV